MDGQFVVALWLTKPLPAASTLDDALALAKNTQLKELLTIARGAEINDSQVLVMGVSDDSALKKMDY